MKAHIPGSVLVLCGLLAAASANGQTTYTWTGAGDGTNLAVAANWGGTLPSTATSDIAQWNGTAPGNLSLVYNNGAWSSGPGQSGVNFHLTSAQTGTVAINTTLNPSSYMAIYNVTIDAGAGSFILGGTNTARRLDVIGRPNGPIVHAYVNNSTSPAIINPMVRWAAGGGAGYTMGFGGTGNWYVTNTLANDNSAGMTIQVDGPGTTYWNPTGYPNKDNLDGVNINGGKLVLQGPSTKLNTRSMVNNAILEFNAPSQSQSLAGVISGSGSIVVSAGTLTLGGNNTFTGNLTLNGGTAIANQAENAMVSGPLGFGMISFNGGTLQYSVNNNYDYSSRFDTAAGQAYRINTGGRAVTFGTPLGGAGTTLTKEGSGTLFLSGESSYTGATTINAGRLVFSGSKTGSGSIVVANNAALGVTATGTAATPASLTVGSTGGATLEFNNVNSTIAAPLAVGTLSAGGAIAVNVNSGTFVAGQSYPLMTWTSGAAPTVSLKSLSGAVGTLSITGNTLSLNVSGIAYVWTGATDGNWDTTTANNWTFAGAPSVFVNGGHALFDDVATQPYVNLNAPVAPASVSVNSSIQSYTITSAGANGIGGSGGLSKNGSTTLTLAGGANTYTGATVIRGGAVSVGSLASGGAASDIGASASAASNLVLDGGGLIYTGPAATIDRGFSLGTGNGFIEASGLEALVLNNTGDMGLSGEGARTLTLSGFNAGENTLAAKITDNSGTTALAKSGTGKWVLTGNNTYSGSTTIAQGTLQVGAGGANGRLGTGDVLDNGTLIFNTTATHTNGLITGTGNLTLDGGGTLILTGNNTYAGTTTINAGTLQLGNGGATGALNPERPIVNNGTLIFNSTSPITIAGFFAVISGSGNVIARGPGLVKTIGANTYTGWTLIEPGATLQMTDGNTGRTETSAITNNGTLLLVRQDWDDVTGFGSVFVITNSVVGTGRVIKENNNANAGWVTLAGTNTYTGGTYIAGGTVVLGDGTNSQSGTLAGDVVFTNTTTPYLNPRTLIFNRFDNFVFTNTISTMVTDGSTAGASGALRQHGPGKAILTADNSYPGTTTIDTGAALQVGNGGTTGTIGTGGVVNDGELTVDRAGSITISGVISGAGNLIKKGPGTLTLPANNTYFGQTIVSNGILVVNGSHAAAAINVYGGSLSGTGSFTGAATLAGGTTLAPGNGVGTMIFYSSLDIGGNMSIEVNKSLPQSNDFVQVDGMLTKTGAGSISLVNLGPLLAVGDKFTLFSQAVAGGAAMTITGPAGTTFRNDLEVDGSITVLTAETQPAAVNMGFSLSGNQLTITWPAAYQGWVLQSQTNSLTTGLGANWVDVDGSGSSTQSVITINPQAPSVFFRLRK